MRYLKSIENDELFFHKAGLILGTVFGLLVGFVISDRADQFEDLQEEVLDDREQDE